MKIRSAHTLLELIVSMSAATLLLGGLASSLMIASTVFDTQIDTIQESRAAEIQTQILYDLGRAVSFSERNSQRVTFNVPDEDGDDVEETLTYRYDDNANTLVFTFNGQSTTLLTGVTTSSFDFLQRDETGSAAIPTPYDTNDWGRRWQSVVFRGYEDHSAADVEFITISTPDETTAGDLLIAAVVADGAEDRAIVPPAGQGWNEICHAGADDQVLLGVWWKLASDAEPVGHTFTRNQQDHMYGWIMRFTGHDPADPIHKSELETGKKLLPTCPEILTGIDGALVLRIGGFDDDDITANSPGLVGHGAINMGDSGDGGSACSGGAGYIEQITAGEAGMTAYTLTRVEEYVTVTIAIAPD